VNEWKCWEGRLGTVKYLMVTFRAPQLSEQKRKHTVLLSEYTGTDGGDNNTKMELKEKNGKA